MAFKNMMGVLLALSIFAVVGCAKSKNDEATDARDGANDRISRLSATMTNMNSTYGFSPTAGSQSYDHHVPRSLSYSELQTVDGQLVAMIRVCNETLDLGHAEGVSDPHGTLSKVQSLKEDSALWITAVHERMKQLTAEGHGQ